jgi:hypothetical protein
MERASEREGEGKRKSEHGETCLRWRSGSSRRPLTGGRLKSQEKLDGGEEPGRVDNCGEKMREED